MTAGFRPTRVFLGADHGGYEVKEWLKEQLQGEFLVVDKGAFDMDPSDDFVPIAKDVAGAVVAEPGSMGILICRSGEGMAIASNKLNGVRASLVWNKSVARETRADNDANILSLPADYITADEALEISQIWLTTSFSGEDRHTRRIRQIDDLEDAKS